DKTDYKLYIPGLIAMDKTDINITITDESEEEYEYVINNSKTSIGNIDIIELGDMKSSQYDCKFLFYLNVNDNKYEYITSGFVADVEQLSVATDITFADYCAYYGEYDCINKFCVYNIKKIFDTDLGYIKINTMNYWLDDESVIDSKI
ncbi:MAG: hypothetical protein K6G26_06170, partial [Lachnospiraceae bacterium]|nr:hypothetical protein [Lachnospiraceae bacterium]